MPLVRMPVFRLQMKRVIFYSWQSDLPNPTNRGFIQTALEKTAKAIAADRSTDDVPIIDRDTEGVPGAPHIAKTIFEKIAAADVFVADVSITQGREDGRPTPNPNVLIELGYALCSLGDPRIVLVLNDAYGGPEDLPFDLKMHRVVRYNMPASPMDRVAERQELQKKLDSVIRAALTRVTPKPSPTPSQAESLLSALTGPQSGFYMTEPDSSTRTEEYYTFACAPHDHVAARLLTGDVEDQFYQSIVEAFDSPPPQRPPKRGTLTIFERAESQIKRQRLALTAGGALGFTTPCYVHTSDGHLFFFASEFIYDLVCFLCCAASYYQKAGNDGECVLHVEVHAPSTANILDRSSRGMLTPGSQLFTEPLMSFQAELSVKESVDLNGITDSVLATVVTAVMHEVARRCGRVLTRNFDADVRRLIANVLERIGPPTTGSERG
jgi:hypothetical protein